MMTFISRAGGKIEIPQLPNELVMNIIKLGDAGKNAHMRKLKPVLELIRSRKWTDENKYYGKHWGIECWGNEETWEQGDPPPTPQQQLMDEMWAMDEHTTDVLDDEFDMKTTPDNWFISQGRWMDGWAECPEKWESSYVPPTPEKSRQELLELIREKQAILDALNARFE